MNIKQKHLYILLLYNNYITSDFYIYRIHTTMSQLGTRSYLLSPSNKKMISWYDQAGEEERKEREGDEWARNARGEEGVDLLPYLIWLKNIWRVQR